ncbi:hypothetical protein CDAR_40301 [Caerostris darwini]|uniref:Uncharacterized protein n=1 Tax=Caerostris darwini TaxID=1538125 RepID=A0AAV4RAY2_9ARAC|nr:hypothetical protein CDAR_40301 [Caerostris darwini]
MRNKSLGRVNGQNRLVVSPGLMFVFFLGHPPCQEIRIKGAKDGKGEGWKGVSCIILSEVGLRQKMLFWRTWLLAAGGVNYNFKSAELSLSFWLANRVFLYFIGFSQGGTNVIGSFPKTGWPN